MTGGQPPVVNGTVGLGRTCAGLPVGEHGAAVAVENILQRGQGGVLEQMPLRRLLPEHPVEVGAEPRRRRVAGPPSPQKAAGRGPGRRGRKTRA